MTSRKDEDEAVVLQNVVWNQRPPCAAASAAPSICPTIPTHCQYLLVHLSTHEFSPTFKSPSLNFLSMHFSWHEETILRGRETETMRFPSVVGQRVWASVVSRKRRHGGRDERRRDTERCHANGAVLGHALVEELDAILHFLRSGRQGRGSGEAPTSRSRDQAAIGPREASAPLHTYRRGVREHLLHHGVLLRGGELGHVDGGALLRHRDTSCASSKWRLLGFPLEERPAGAP